LARLLASIIAVRVGRHALAAETALKDREIRLIRVVVRVEVGAVTGRAAAAKNARPGCTGFEVNGIIPIHVPVAVEIAGDHSRTTHTFRCASVKLTLTSGTSSFHPPALPPIVPVMTGTGRHARRVRRQHRYRRRRRIIIAAPRTRRTRAAGSGTGLADTTP